MRERGIYVDKIAQCVSKYINDLVYYNTEYNLPFGIILI